jgi:hypothetical protein
MKKHEQITKGLIEIGACWATSTQRYICARHECCQMADGDKAAYHVQPDASMPWEASIRKFYNLDEITAYIKAQKECKTDPEHAFEIMDDFEEWLTRNQ